MRSFPRKLPLLLLALSLLLSLPAAASFALGDDLFSTATALHRNTTLTTNVFWGNSISDFRTENYVAYTPNAAVTPVVTYGSYVTALNRVTTAAKGLEGQGYRVVAGINGDYYNTSTGVPIGLVVTDGVIRSGTYSYTYAVGFRSDGSAIMGKPALSLSATFGANAQGIPIVRRITNINKARETGGIYLYTHDFNAKHTTGTVAAGVEVLCEITEGSIAIGKSATLTVKEVRTASATPIGVNEVAFSVTEDSGPYLYDALYNMQPGQTIPFSVTCDDARWNDVVCATGALYQLVTGGQAVSGLDSVGNPRTAIGLKADGTVILYTIDGRKSGHSMGASQKQVAARLIELGCVEAVCLDGGGSTALVTTAPGSTASALVNTPSEGSERSVSTQIFLVASGEPSGVLSHFYIRPDHNYVLAGTTVNMAVTALDANYFPMTADYTLTASAGEVTGSSLKTPAAGGDVTVTATGEGASGQTTVHAVTKPESLRILKGDSAISSLSLAAGKSVSLTPSVTYRHKTIPSDPTLFTWQVTGGIGSVDKNGLFTAAALPGSGSITCSYGGVKRTIPVTITARGLVTLETFEGSYAHSAIAQDTATVHNGRASGKLSYSLADGEIPVSYTLPAGYDTLNLWVYGDGSGNDLSFVTNGGEVSVPLTFTGWKQLSLRLPGSSLTALAVSGETESGVIYLDQLTASYLGVVDSAAPEVTMHLSGSSLTATVTDYLDGTVKKENLSLTYDGKPLAFALSGSSLTATVPAGAHRVSLIAGDGSGNLVKKSVDVPAAADSPFTDTAASPFAKEISYLYHAGVTLGYGDGTFRPGNAITRQEFAVMLYRYLGLSDADYAHLESPFADEESIGAFAKTAVRALHALGVINGTEMDGTLYFNPESNITRAQAAAMIGRLSQKGFALSTLSFTDAASIPAYAVEHVRLMCAQGVVGGYGDNTFRPGSPITRGQMAKILYNSL